jgi:hypothetical protein
MGLLDEIKKDMLWLLDKYGEICKYNEMLLHHNDILDKRNYNPDKVDKIRNKLNVLYEQYYEVKNKWF